MCLFCIDIELFLVLFLIRKSSGVKFNKIVYFLIVLY